MEFTRKQNDFYEAPKLVMRIFAWISAGVMIFNLGLICCDVFMRYAFNSPIKGTTEIVTMLMAWVAYSGMAYTLLKGKHMQLGAIYEKFHGRAQHILSFFIYLIATIFFLVMIKASWEVFASSWAVREKSVASVTVYVFIGKFGAFLGWLLLAVQSVFMTIYCVTGILHPDKVASILIQSEIPAVEDSAAATLGTDVHTAKDRAGKEDKHDN